MSIYIPEIRTEKPEKRSGHICVHFRDSVIVWGGFNDVLDNDSVWSEYLPSESLWVYNVSTCIWKHHVCSGEVPPSLSGTCAACVGETMYLFGGHSAIGLGHCNDLFSLNLTTFRWNHLSRSVQGQLPIPRDKFGCWVFENRIIYFGGYGPSPGAKFRGTFVVHEASRGWNDQTVVLQMNRDGSHEWQYPSVTGTAPKPRAAHGMARMGKKGFLFGGRHSIRRDNDLHFLDLEKYEWSGRLNVEGPQPCGRSWHIFSPCGENHILLYGGFDAANEELGDAWLLDVFQLTWIQIDAFERLSPTRTRLWHTACQTRNEGEVAIFGGSSNSPYVTPTEHTNDLIFFRFKPPRLQRLCEDTIVKSKKTPPHVLLSTLPRQLFRTLVTRLHISEARTNR